MALESCKIVHENGGDRLVARSGGSIDVESGGEIDIESGGAFKSAGTDIAAVLAASLVGLGATAAELNAVADQSAGVQAIVAAGAITADGTKNRVTLSGGAYAVTLAAPGAGAVGKFLCIEYVGGDTDANTLALTNVVGGSAASQASFNADGEGLLLFGAATKWVVIKEFGGVTMS